MHKYMKSADIVICRSGAITLAEIAASKVAAILIPSPNVSDNHQYKNATLLSAKNAAIVIEEKELSEAILTREIDALVTDSIRRKNMSKCIELFAKEDAEIKILNEIDLTLKPRQNKSI